MKSNHSSFLKLTEVGALGGRCPLPPEFCAKSDPPPSEKHQLIPIPYLLITSEV